jgi:hypothetical protein
MKTTKINILLALLVIVGGMTIQAQEQRNSGLIITDTVWLNDIGRCDDIIIKNFTTETITISGVEYDHDTPLDVLLPFPCQYPYTLPVGDSIFLSVWLQVPFSGKGDYTPSDIQIITSLEDRTVVAMMASSTLVDHGLVHDSPTNFYIPIPEMNHLTGIMCNQNYGTLTPITIYSIAEDGTDYFDIVPQHELPYDLPVKEYFRVDMYLRLDLKDQVTGDFIGVNIILESSAGQITYSILFVSDLLNVNEIFDEVKLYPNPTKDFIKIEGVEVAEVQVYSALGQMVKKVRGSNEINLSGLAEGVYLLRILDSDESIYTNKITIR